MLFLLSHKPFDIPFHVRHVLHYFHHYADRQTPTIHLGKGIVLTSYSFIIGGAVSSGVNIRSNTGIG